MNYFRGLWDGQLTLVEIVQVAILQGSKQDSLIVVLNEDRMILARNPQTNETSLDPPDI